MIYTYLSLLLSSAKGQAQAQVSLRLDLIFVNQLLSNVPKLLEMSKTNHLIISNFETVLIF